VRVLERHPHPTSLPRHGLPLPGYVRLDMPGNVRSIREHELEFRDDPSLGNSLPFAVFQ
jgi:hypothetical protein